jgi:hypothetical protein
VVNYADEFMVFFRELLMSMSFSGEKMADWLDISRYWRLWALPLLPLEPQSSVYESPDVRSTLFIGLADC